VKVGPQTFEKKVRSGVDMSEQLGKVALAAGNHEIRLSAKAITGEELMRLRSVMLKPTH
jgi:hypothetical protein